jgi:coatomer subunit gamma
LFYLAGGSNPFKNLEKASVLQETRTFNETPINAKKCCFILTKILYMINQVIKNNFIFVVKV